jgi:hypothetical protein
VNVYVESNFVLELALLQEQQASCTEILRLSETGKVRLVIPAYSLAEPYETLVRRHKQRKRMKAELDVELRQAVRLTSDCGERRRNPGFHSAPFGRGHLPYPINPGFEPPSIVILAP